MNVHGIPQELIHPDAMKYLLICVLDETPLNRDGSCDECNERADTWHSRRSLSLVPSPDLPRRGR